MARRALRGNRARRMNLAMRTAVLSMHLFVLSTLLVVLPTLGTVLPTVQAQVAPQPSVAQAEARKIFDRAIAAQGRLPRGAILDVYVKFEGDVKQKGQNPQSAVREYWLRPKDRSFRIKTTAGADPSKPYSERGVLGSPKELFWESVKNKRVTLIRSNREHRKNMKAIQRDREEFERIVRMVVLTRLNDSKTKVSFANPRKVRLEKDQPNSANAILGKDRKKEYHVLDIQRPGADLLRLFVRAEDFTVRKVVQFDRSAPGKIKSVSYFGFYRRNANAAGLLLPQAFSVYSAVPDGKKNNEATVQVSGRLQVAINGDLPDSVFSPDGR